MKTRDLLNRATHVVGEWIGGGLIGVGMVTVFICMAVGTADVIAAKFGAPFPGAKELIEEFMVVMALTGVVYVQVKGKHISLDIVTSRVSLRWRFILETLGYVVGLVVCGLLAWRSISLFTAAVEKSLFKMGEIPIPLLPSHLLIMLSFIIAAIFFLLLVIRNAAGAREITERQEK